MPHRERHARVRSIAPALLMTAVLGACSDLYYDRRESVSFQAGNAVAANAAVETIDPWPAAAADRRIAGNGQLVHGAMERYRTGKVTPPQGTDTSSVKYLPALAAPTAPSAGAPNP
jgi:hypothetical protein